MTSTRNWPGAWALRGALVVALAAVAAAGWQLAVAMPDGPGMGPMGSMGRHGHQGHHGPMDMPMGGMGGMGAMGAMGGPMLQRLLADVNATPEQRSRIADIMKAAREDMAGQRDAQRSLRDKAMALFTQPTLDANAAEALRQQMQAGHEQRSKRMLQAMLDAAAVLTPEQRAQLGQRMQQRRELMERHRAERDALEQRQR